MPEKGLVDDRSSSPSSNIDMDDNSDEEDDDDDDHRSVSHHHSPQHRRTCSHSLPSTSTSASASTSASILAGSTSASKTPRILCNTLTCILTSLTLATATFLFSISFLLLLIYLILHPRAPRFSLQNAEFNVTRHRVERAKCKGNPELDEVANPQCDIANASVALTVAAQNPNTKIDIMYEGIRAELFYGLGDEDMSLIGEGSITAFYQGHQSTNLLRLELKGGIKRSTFASSTFSTNSTNCSAPSGTKLSCYNKTLNDPVTDTENSKGLLLSARAIAHFRIKVGWWKSGVCLLQFLCAAHIPLTSLRILNNDPQPRCSHVIRLYAVHLISHKCTFNLKSLVC